ncbi:GNAT family N-acetyltransferase [Maribacter sp. X9]|uniref:GNAT family N-acetyltransferase n=1 Tax=Maribacter sp. X9 TaxID=3402159 RepID=UPI003AF3BAC6
MVKLHGDQIYLRALERTDLNFLYELENNPEVWEISGTLSPYSKDVLQLYLDNAHRDVFEVKQLRLVISSNEHKTLGLVDIFDFDPHHKRAGLGIIVLDEKQRNKGIGAQAITLLCDYVFNVLDLRQVFANILEENQASLHLFKKLGFIQIGIKKDWIRTNGSYKNEVLLQKINC